MDGETFIRSNLLTIYGAVSAAKVFIILFHLSFVQRDVKLLQALQDSQDERIALGDCYTVFEVCCQRPVCRDNSPLVR